MNGDLSLHLRETGKDRARETERETGRKRVRERMRAAVLQAPSGVWRGQSSRGCLEKPGGGCGHGSSPADGLREAGFLRQMV